MSQIIIRASIFRCAIQGIPPPESASGRIVGMTRGRAKNLFPCHARAAGIQEGAAHTRIIIHIQKEHRYYIYILASKRNGTLYVGVTNSLFGRIFRHKLKENSNSFTARYNVTRLVYYEIYQYIQAAIRREKQLKKLTRAEKIDLIEKDNPAWRDLFEEME